MATPEQRELAAKCRQLAKLIGPGRRISAQEQARLYREAMATKSTNRNEERP